MRNKRKDFWQNRSIGEFVTWVNGNEIIYKLDEESNKNVLIIKLDDKVIHESFVSGIDEVESILTSKGLF
jgi:hypothetical protein